MRALILAAGDGRRSGLEVPKPLFSFAGRTLLDWQLTSLRATVDEVGIIIQAQQTLFDEYDLVKFREAWSPDTNMVASLFCARPWLDGSSDLLVVYGDILYQSEIVRDLVRNEPGNLLLPVNTSWRDLWETRFPNPLADAESLKVDPRGVVTEIGGRPQSYSDIDAQYMGIVFIPASLQTPFSNDWADYSVEHSNASMTEYLAALLNRGYAIKARPTRGGWIEFDTAEDIDLYEAMRTKGTLTRFIDLERI